MDSDTAARRYAKALRPSWPARDVEAFLALFAEDAVFQPPFGPPQSAHEHMRWAYALGESVAVWVGEPMTAGNTAAVEWWAVIVDEGEPGTFAAVALIEFDDEGLVVHERDYWNTKAERIEPRPGWGNIS